MPRHFAHFLVIAVALSLPAAAQAQSSDRATAEAIFRAGRDAADAGDWKTACERFEESNRLEPAVGTVLNLAHCREQLGQLASAWQRYLEVVQRLPRSDERYAIAKERAVSLEARVPRLTLILAEGAPPGTVVLKDDVQLGRGSLRLALPVNPGSHVIVVRAPGRVDVQSEVTVAEGERQDLLLEVGAIAPEDAALPSDSVPADAERAPANDDSGRRTAGFVAGGIGIAGLITSAVAGGLALSKKSTVEKECVDKRCSPEGVQAGDDGHTFASIASIAAVVGVVGLGVGAYFVLSSDSGSPSSEVSVSATPAGGFVGYRRRF